MNLEKVLDEVKQLFDIAIKDSNVLELVRHISIGVTDVDKIIEKFELKEVKTPEIYLGSDFHPQGLFSTEIFGPIGSFDRYVTPAYIDLEGFGKFFPPHILHLIKLSSRKVFDALTSVLHPGLIYNPQTKTLEEAKEITDQNLKGNNLTEFILKNYEEIANLSERVKKALRKYGEKIVSDKIIVIPPELRPMSKDDVGPINQVYIKILQTKLYNKPDDKTNILQPVSCQINNALYQLYKAFEGHLGKKFGEIRESLLGKRLDFTGRSVIVNNPELKPYEVGIPCRMAAKVNEPRVKHVLYEGTYSKTKEPFIQVFKKLGVTSIQKIDQLLDDYANGFLDPQDDYDRQLIEVLEDAIRQATEGMYALLKRDPALKRDSWWSYKLKCTDGLAIEFSPLALHPHSGDFDGDSVHRGVLVELYEQTPDGQFKLVYDGPIGNLPGSELFEG